MNEKQKLAFIDFIETVPGEVILYSLEISDEDEKYHESVYIILKYSPNRITERILEEMAKWATWDVEHSNGLMLLAAVGMNRMHDSPKDSLLSKIMLIAKNKYGYHNFVSILNELFGIPLEIIDKNYVDWLCSITIGVIETISQEKFENCVEDFCVVISIDQRIKLKRVLMSFCMWPQYKLNKLTQLFMEPEYLSELTDNPLCPKIK